MATSSEECGGHAPVANVPGASVPLGAPQRCIARKARIEEVKSFSYLDHNVFISEMYICTFKLYFCVWDAILIFFHLIDIHIFF